MAEGASRPRTRRREVDSDTRGDGLFNAFESNVNAFLRLVRDTTGARASPSFVRGLIENTLTDITRRRVSVATLRLYPDGVVLEGLAIGENLTVDKLLVRAKLQPLLEVMGEWQTAAEGAPAPEIYIDSVRTRGVRCVDTDFDGIRDAFDLYVHAPGAIVIRSLKLYDLTFDIAPHASFEGRDVAPKRRLLRLAALALGTEDPVDSRKPTSSLAGCVSKLLEPGRVAIEAGVDVRSAEARRSSTVVVRRGHELRRREGRRYRYYPGTKILKTMMAATAAGRKKPAENEGPVRGASRVRSPRADGTRWMRT